MINKKIFKVSYIVFYFIFMILFFPSITNAENKYFFTKEELDGTKIEEGKIGAGSGFDTKAECDTYVKSVNSSWKPSTCYAGGNVTITSVSPSSGKIGDLITIKGTNLNDVVGVSFNGRDAGYSNPKMTSQIEPYIPSGATSGVITVKTRYRGTATYKNFTISKQDDLYWWYLNNSNEYYGASGRLSTPGFTNEADCNKDRLEYEASSSQAKTTGPCFQETETTILKDRSNLYPIEAVKEKSTDTTTYNLLAPIGDLESVSSMNISDYFSLMLKIIIGLCAVSAVIMIVIGGIQYMGKDSIFGKAEAKGKIINAITGLIIALGSYALLNTINPDLLGVKGLGIKQVKGEITYETNSIYKKTAADGARCKVVTSGDCSVENLKKTFGNKAEAMSKICNIESSGVASKVSGGDVDIDGIPFSFGLFQINIIANGNHIRIGSERCGGLFTKGDGSKIVDDNYIIKVNGKYKYDARLNPKYESLYNKCKSELLRPELNIAVASKLTLSAWKYSDGDICPSAFN